MRLTITVVEDQKTDVDDLNDEILLWSRIRHTEIALYVYQSGEDFYKKYSSYADQSDIYFLDIQLGDTLGIKIAKDLRSHGYQKALVFLTAYREYVFKGYDVQAMNYLLKPVERKTLFACLDQAVKSTEKKYYLFHDRHEIVRIELSDILFFSSSLHYVDIFTLKGEFCQYTTLKAISELLPNNFLQIHRSYIVNLDHINKFSKSKITLSNNATVPIGRSYINILIRKLQSFQ